MICKLKFCRKNDTLYFRIGVNVVELFKNKVGRPSNEILKRRKIFKTGIILGVIAIIIGMFSLGYFNIINL